MKKDTIVIGTRSSKLALWQAEYVKGRLEEEYPGLKVELKLMTTKGDKILDAPLAKIGGKGLFTKELETAMLNGDIDIAVHSLKDMPVEVPEGLKITAVTQREDPGDVLVSPKYKLFSELPKGAKIGTSSLRRKAQLLSARPDLTTEQITKETAKKYGTCTVIAAWLAVFCLFGYRSSFSIMQSSLMEGMSWTSTQASLGYCFMMTFYAITAYFSGGLIDKKGTRPAYTIGAICCFLGFFLTSFIPEGASWSFPVYLVTYGIFAGVGTGMLWVSSTISCRKWYVGTEYGTKWGLAFMGAPMAQLLLTIVVSPILKSAGWSAGMKVLSVIMAVMLLIAAAVAKPMPDKVGAQPFGLDSLPKKKADAAKPAHVWTVGEAFKTRALWCDIFAFMFAVMGEFLIWSQIVRYFTVDLGWTQPSLLGMPLANVIYMVIGLAGIFTMPLTGKASDALVKRMGVERPARRMMLVISPLFGIAGVLLALSGNLPVVIVGMVLLAVYWGIEPGGAAGYAGTVFGGASLGKIWGLATLIIMGIGPSFGTFMGAFLFDTFQSYVPALYFGIGAYVVSTISALLLPGKVESK